MLFFAVLYIFACDFVLEEVNHSCAQHVRRFRDDRTTCAASHGSRALQHVSLEQ
jgi:hypothetical protein